MKISIGAKIIEGPYGGGNEFIRNLNNYFIHKGHIVVDHLNDNDIDIILLTNPLIDSETSTYNNFDIDYYLKFKNPNAITFQRINECDERKGTDYVNSRINSLNKNLDINIFVSEWIRDIYKEFELSKKKSYVVKGGPTKDTFNLDSKKFWDGKEKLKLVTHHWSSNLMKGYSTYKEIDSLISTPEINNNIEFTFIGNLPENFEFKNTTVLKPLVGKELANELKKHHIYLTASVNEPSGNHHMEGALCGLPILYINSGALPEYCNEYGVVFDVETFPESLKKIVNKYDELKVKLESYPYHFENAAISYEELFSLAVNNRKEIVKKRKVVSKVTVITKYHLNKVKAFLYFYLISIKRNFGKIKKFIYK